MLPTDTQNMLYLLLLYGKNDYAIAPQWYLMRTLPVLLLSKQPCW